jgi:hypothetical protein
MEEKMSSDKVINIATNLLNEVGFIGDKVNPKEPTLSQKGLEYLESEIKKIVSEKDVRIKELEERSRGVAFMCSSCGKYAEENKKLQKENEDMARALVLYESSVRHMENLKNLIRDYVS